MQISNYPYFCHYFILIRVYVEPISRKLEQAGKDPNTHTFTPRGNLEKHVYIVVFLRAGGNYTKCLCGFSHILHAFVWAYLQFLPTSQNHGRKWTDDSELPPSVNEVCDALQQTGVPSKLCFSLL